MFQNVIGVVALCGFSQQNQILVPLKLYLFNRNTCEVKATMAVRTCIVFKLS